MIFWLATVALLLLGSVFVVLPLLGHHDDGSGDDSSRAEANVKLYEERISELRQEQSAGYLDETDFEILVAELQRSLLQDTGSAKYDAGGYSTDLHNENTHKVLVAADRSNVSRLAPLFGLLLIPILAYGLYDRSGYHDDVQLSDLFRQAIHPVTIRRKPVISLQNSRMGFSNFQITSGLGTFLAKAIPDLECIKKPRVLISQQFFTWRASLTRLWP